MKEQSKYSPLRLMSIVAFVAFALAIIIQVALGRTEYPPIPPGIFFALFAAICLAVWRRQKWAGIVAFLIALMPIIGGFIAKWHEKLFQPETTAYLAIVLQWASLVVAVVGTGALLFTEYFKKRA